MTALEDRAEAFAKARNIESADDAVVIARWGTSEWVTLFSYAAVVKLPAGSTLIRQRGAERDLYFLTSGSLEATVSYGEQTLAPLRIIRPGSVVGEVAFFDAAPRSARVWAVEDSELLRLGIEDYDRFAAENLALANELLLGLGRLVALRLRDLTVRTTSPQ